MLNPGSKGGPVTSELALADEEHRAAELLMEMGHPRIALTRAYFMAFRAVRAQLYAEGLEPGTPADVHGLWHDRLVSSGRYDASTSRLLARLQKLQEEADDVPGFVVDEAGAREEITAARGLVERIRKELAGPPQQPPSSP